MDCLIVIDPVCAVRAQHDNDIMEGLSSKVVCPHVNEYIPSTLEWPEVGQFELRTGLPHAGQVQLLVTRATALGGAPKQGAAHAPKPSAAN